MAAVAALLAAVALAGAAAWGWHPAVRGIIAVLAGLVAGGLLRRLARRRLGGLTGDVYGALVEVSSAVTLLALALTA
jgi:adenosylcobinamide-GDP ribazoletransferase